MSDEVIITALVCITTLGVVAIMAISDYKKNVKAKTVVRDLISNEIAITNDDIKSK